MGRPKKQDKPEPFRNTITLRIPDAHPGLLEKLEALAGKEERSLNNYIIIQLAKIANRDRN